MTSPLNYQQTLDFFANNYYGLNRNDVFVFQQGTLPNFSLDGKILWDIDSPPRPTATAAAFVRFTAVRWPICKTRHRVRQLLAG